MRIRSCRIVKAGVIAFAAIVAGMRVVSGASTQSPAAWEAVGPAPPAIMTPVVADRGTGTVYIPTFGGGVLKSTDDGRSFIAVNSGLGSLAVTAFAANPRDGRHLFLSTFGAGAFQSMDGGARWTPLATPGSVVLSIAVDPIRPSTLYIGMLGGARVRKSVDGGASWSDANTGLPNATVWTLAIDREDPNVLYAGTGGGGAFKSLDAGASWRALPLPTNVFAMAIDPRDRRILYAGTDGRGVYRSFDGGETFAPAGTPGGGRVVSLAVDPGRQGVVYAGTLGQGVEVSTDFAATFTPTALARGMALALATSDAGDVYVGTGFNGVLRSGSYGAVWSPVAVSALHAIAAQNVYGLTVDPQNPARVLAATNEGGVLESLDGGRTWQEANDGFASHTARVVVFDPVDSRRAYAGSFPGGGVQVSDDRGRTWTPRLFAGPGVYVWAVGVGPDRAVYAATTADGLWRSRDGAATFVRLPTPVTDIRGIAVDPGNARHLLAASNQGLYRSTDDGATWTRVLTTFTSNVVFDRRTPSIVYASTQTAGVQRSTDGGATFAPLNTGLTSLQTSRGAGVLIDPRDSRVLYIATEGGGVFKSRDGGERWVAINQGLANLSVFALAIDPSNPDILYAGGASSVFKTVTGGEPRTP